MMEGVVAVLARVIAEVDVLIYVRFLLLIGSEVLGTAGFAVCVVDDKADVVVGSWSVGVM